MRQLLTLLLDGFAEIGADAFLIRAKTGELFHTGFV
jgi:hypothetical protein